MTGKIIVNFMITLGICFAAEQVVRIELTHERLNPLFDRGLKVIAELEDWAILLVDTGDLDKISNFSYTILDTDPEEGRYYLVRLVDTTIDLNRFGEVLTSDGIDYLLKIEEEMLEELIKQKVMVKRLMFVPIIKSEAPLPRFLYSPIVQ
ncbi:MAG: hypothetical protein JSV97_13035 [candidate division WOR-3 bacterium]|nr:MAG: hypothetical protein JSV97_13035 [candidate division WOR-3 bacterium]